MKLLLIPLCVAGALVLPKSFTVGEAAPAGVTGTVMFEGDRPDPLPALTIKDEEAKGCHEDGHAMDTTDRSLLISEKGGIANVVITIAVDDAEVKLREEPIIMDQSGCRFEPHVQVVRVGETIRYLNSDATNHNIHTYAKKNKNINNNVAGGTSYDMPLEKEETIKVACDIHPWMGCYIFVTEASHFAVSKEDGTFEVKGVPAGTHKVEYWHETLGKGKAEVTVAEDGTGTLAITMGEKKKGGGRRR